MPGIATYLALRHKLIVGESDLAACSRAAIASSIVGASVSSSSGARENHARLAPR